MTEREKVECMVQDLAKAIESNALLGMKLLGLEHMPITDKNRIGAHIAIANDGLIIAMQGLNSIVE